MPELVSYLVREQVAVITIDNPPVNALSSEVAEGIERCVHDAEIDDTAKAVVVIGSGSTFIAGADIHEFGEIIAGRRPPLNLLPFLAAIEDCPKPVIMALHGTAFGGGLETAMAGHYRVISSEASVGQPEVKLGLIPGAGGTQRLPRLASLPTAIKMCTTGDPIKAPEAVAAGIADKLIQGDLLTGAIAFALDVVGKPMTKTRDREDKLRNSPPELFAEARVEARKKYRGRLAPLAAIDAIEAAVTFAFEEGCQQEAALFQKCLFSAESKALIHVFFSERAVSKIPGISKDTKPLPIARAAIVGAGTMGGGIAMNYANAGIPVRLKETSQQALDRGMASIHKNYQASINKGRLTSQAMEAKLALITPQLTYAGFDEADIITEAVFESMALKKQILAELDGIAKPDCLLATNTSSLDIDQIAESTNRPHMVIGTHFFSPANVMKLLEVVRGKATGPQVIATAMALGKRLGKVAVLAGNCFGFIGNRMVDKYLRQAYFLVEEGATVEQVNQSLFDFGMAMGPLAMDDLAGIDVGCFIRNESHLAASDQRQPLIPNVLHKMGRLGQKTGRGWSQYDAQRKPSPDPEVAALIEDTARANGIKRRKITNEEVVERCIGALVEEGRRILQEGIALRSGDIDIVYIYGYGFPAWRGGPLFYADSMQAELPVSARF